MRPLVLYHGNCTDGFGAAFAAWTWFGAEAEYRPMNYGEPLPPDAELAGREVYVLDFSFPQLVMDHLVSVADRTVWLDHHKTAFEEFGQDPTQRWDDQTLGEHGVTIELHPDQSGAMIAWEYFHGNHHVPLIIKHIDDRDRWQFKISGSRELHEGLQALKPWSFEQWHQLVRARDSCVDLKTTGKVLLAALDRRVAELASHSNSCWLYDQAGEDVEGHAVNAGPDVASELGNRLAKLSGTYGLVWHIDGESKINCSLRSIGDFDVSAIAKKYGGGGHKNSAGFRLDDVIELADIVGLDYAV